MISRALLVLTLCAWPAAAQSQRAFCFGSGPLAKCRTSLILEGDVLWSVAHSSHIVVGEFGTLYHSADLNGGLSAGLGLMVNWSDAHAVGGLLSLGTTGTGHRIAASLRWRRWNSNAVRRFDVSTGFLERNVSQSTSSGHVDVKARGATFDVAYGSQNLVALTAGADVVRTSTSTHSMAYWGVRLGSPLKNGRAAKTWGIVVGSLALLTILVAGA